jgi:hypothetical protein
VRSNIWRNNLLWSLEEMGHEVVEFTYDLTETFRNLDVRDAKQAAFVEKNRPRVSAELVRQVRAAHTEKPVDLFFSYFYDTCVLPEAIGEIRGLGIRTVNWYCNGSYQLELVREISPAYDFCLVPEKFRLGDYEAMGARPIYCQEAANPAVYKPHEVEKEFDVTFVGQAYGDRPLFLRYLLERGIRVHVWGHGWRDPHPKYVPRETFEAIMALPVELRNDPLADEELVKMYSRSRINLGFSTCGDTHAGGERILQVRLRDFEVPMSGGFYLVERMEELGEFFEYGKEIAGYRGREELAEQIAYYLGHEEERAAIAAAGLRRARGEQTWAKRFEMAFAKMGL